MIGVVVIALEVALCSLNFSCCMRAVGQSPHVCLLCSDLSGLSAEIINISDLLMIRLLLQSSPQQEITGMKSGLFGGQISSSINSGTS